MISVRKLDESESGQMVLEKVKWAYSYVYHHTHTKIPWQGQVQWFLEDSAIHAMLRVFLRHKMHFIMNKFSVEYFSILSKLFCNLSRYHDFDWQEFAKRRRAKRVVCHNLYLLPSFVTNLTGPGKFVPIFWHFCRFLEWSYNFCCFIVPSQDIVQFMEEEKTV